MNFIQRAAQRNPNRNPQQQQQPPSNPLFPRAPLNPFQNSGQISQPSYSTSTSWGKFPSSNLDKYSVKPAPKTQFKRYMQKVQNVFYDDRYEMKVASIIKVLIILLLVFLLVVSFLYLSLSIFQPFEGPAPKHGSVRNKVLYCDFGYEKQGNQCVVSEDINLEAEHFAKKLVEDLRMEYGDYDCSHTTGFPSRNVREIINDNENLELRKANILFQQAQLFLRDSSNKQQYKYDYANDVLWPTQKLYSYNCRIKLLLQSGVLWKVIAVYIIIAVLCFYLYRWYSRRQTAWKIYTYLKDKVLLQDTVNIQQENANIQKIGHLDEGMWEMVDKFRTNEQLIGFFEDDNLYWKRLR